MPDDHLRRLAENNRAEIQEGKVVVFGIKALADTHTTEIERNKQDISKIDERLRTLSEASGANASRDQDQDRRMQDLEQRQTRTDQQIGDLSVVVTEAVGAAKTMTGAFQDVRGQIDALRLAEATAEEPAGEGVEAWLARWRAAATPTNLVLLVVIVTTIGSLLRGEITRTDAAAQIRAATAEAIEASAPPVQVEP